MISCLRYSGMNIRSSCLSAPGVSSNGVRRKAFLLRNFQWLNFINKEILTAALYLDWGKSDHVIIFSKILARLMAD